MIVCAQCTAQGGAYGSVRHRAVRRQPAAKRGIWLAGRVAAVGGQRLSVRSLGGTRAGEMRAHRFLNNEAVTVAEIVETATARTALRCEGRYVLAIQDSTNLRADPAGGVGLRLHPTILVDATDGALLGLGHAEVLEPGEGQAKSRRQRSFDEKESRRWLTAAEQVMSEAGAVAERVTVVGDSESDVFELFARRPEGCGLLIRAQQDRCVENGKRLFSFADSLPEGGRAQVDLPAAPGRRARTMTLALRFSRVTLMRPKNASKQDRETLPEAVPVWVVDAREIDAPAGVEPAHWRLLTTDQVNDAADARRVVGFYRQRWAIEQLFRTMKKKGFDVEGLRLKSDTARAVLAAITLVVAIIVQQMVHDRDGTARRPIDDAFDADDLPTMRALCAKLEGKTARQKNPHPPDSLAYAAWVCARLGGWTGYYGKPGPIVMLHGWLAFQRIKHGWDLALRDV